MRRPLWKFVILAIFPCLPSCQPSWHLSYRGTDIEDSYHDLRVVGDREHDRVRLSSAWRRFEIPLPYAEDWEIFDILNGTIFAESADLKIMVRVYRTNFPLRREDREAELRETHLRATNPREIDQVTFRQRDSETLLEYINTSTTPRWFAVCGNRRLDDPPWNYLITIKVKERPEPAMSTLLERIRDAIARDFRTLPEP